MFSPFVERFVSRRSGIHPQKMPGTQEPGRPLTSIVGRKRLHRVPTIQHPNTPKRRRIAQVLSIPQSCSPVPHATRAVAPCQNVSLWIHSSHVHRSANRNLRPVVGRVAGPAGQGPRRYRVQMAKLGHLGDVRPVGDGIMEMRVDVGPGYRLYFTRRSELIILLCGGDKSTQARDIKRAKAMARDLEE